jgi:hypothetical protein
MFNDEYDDREFPTDEQLSDWREADDYRNEGDEPDEQECFEEDDDNMTNAYTATIRLLTNGFLLGGCRHHTSSAFESREDAEFWAKTAREINLNRAGYRDANITVSIDAVCANPNHIIRRDS